VFEGIQIMATFKLHPALSAYHANFDTKSHSEEERKTMLKEYEDGRIVFLNNSNLNLDFDLFESINIPPHPTK
jgi:hypothetical protein